MLVNSADILLKGMIVLKVLCYIDSEEAGGSKSIYSDTLRSIDVAQTCYLVEPENFWALLAWLLAAVFMNIMLALISWWRCYANNFLHWGAFATWLLLLIQGKLLHNNRNEQ